MTGTKGEIVVVPEGEFDRVVAEHLAEALKSGGRSGDVTLALAGGNTPEGGYRRLAEIDGIPWERVEVFFGDERAVPPHHPQSNYRMARDSLLSRVPLREESVYRMEAEHPDREVAARRYEGLLPEALAILVLGIGEDGHTASLFPGGDAVREVSRRVVPTRGPVPPRDRLTITPVVVLHAERVFVLARGPGKARAVRRALRGPVDPHQCPAQLARGGTWILDEAAAGGMEISVGGGSP